MCFWLTSLKSIKLFSLCSANSIPIVETRPVHLKVFYGEKRATSLRRSLNRLINYNFPAAQPIKSVLRYHQDSKSLSKGTSTGGKLVLCDLSLLLWITPSWNEEPTSGSTIEGAVCALVLDPRPHQTASFSHHISPPRM
jgi:hypothetical protein